ncbi:signal transduction histidine kinase [Kaistia soli DSM 19436]|uniref:histidine kinase n=1 Tax=Kaistia soli DSM 19436 TaxID=1122133 RepID=A0A1M5A716_9HYPH|nr:histidine kinase dimerization/phosphoacceptor domain -containing protein [Kaistia soli]SHF25954.1 signal transduction histidine kinase [Kaistia soli DSM 19436]
MEPQPVVLFIDDDPGLCRLAVKDLTRHDFVVETATDGDAGLARLAEGGIDIVALDHHMPGRTGLQVLPLIAAMPNPPPVVYVTGEAQGRIAIAALKAGAADYVIKEASEDFFPLLRAALASALTARRLQEAHQHAEAEVRAARDRFEALANERALIIQEVNHRVGNSLQLVASLLNMQAAAHPDAAVKSALAAAVGRVMAVSQVHRRLYTSDDVHSVALDLYLGSLIEDLARTIEANGDGGQISFKLEPLAIRPDRAVALGVIMTELILNALKYAYPGASGAVRVSCMAIDGNIAMTVEDDGVGSGEDTRAVGTGLGRRIIQALASKLEASIEHDVQHSGTRITIRFPEREPRQE